MYGKAGNGRCRRNSNLISQGLGIGEDAVLVASTGVIGKPLPMERLRSAVPGLVANLSSVSLSEVAGPCDNRYVSEDGNKNRRSRGAGLYDCRDC
jgi:N-acetylglutamate synthase/N-acetylornithine aminotransferase